MFFQFSVDNEYNCPVELIRADTEVAPEAPRGHTELPAGIACVAAPRSGHFAGHILE